jgi:probable F420-dependent oxidoreductase
VAFVAGKTSRLRLVTSVTVVPHRPAVLQAKMLATIDVLSNGRLTFGIGAGWMKEEFQALGVPPFPERGAVTDEYLDAFVELWTKDDPRFEGRHVKFADILFEPKPVQKPHPPIWVGGESGPALRRTARIGDAWYPIGTNPQHRLDSMKRFQSGVERLRRLTREAGRDPSKMGLAYRVTSWGKSLPDRAHDGERRLFSGETADVIADLRTFRDFGVGYVDLNFDGATADTMLSNMRRFREDVLAKV